LILPSSAFIVNGTNVTSPGGVQQYDYLSPKFTTSYTYSFVGPSIDFDVITASSALDGIKQIDFNLEASDSGSWDYKITFYDGITNITGNITISKFAIFTTGTITANEDTIQAINLPGPGSFSVQYYSDINGGIYAGIQLCGISCQPEIILIPLKNTISSNPMTHLTVTSTGSDSLTVAVLTSTIEEMAKKEPAGQIYSCRWDDIGTWPGCILNWAIANLPYFATFLQIIATLWSIGAFFFSNFILFALLIPALIFAYRVNIEPDIFLAISKTSVDMIYLAEMILRFFLYIIKIFIPI
jgi:hypothetical protein